MKLNKCKDIVVDILTELPETRDNDILLMQGVWRKQMEFYGVQNLDDQPIWFLFKSMRNKRVSHPSSIKRVRAKLQEQCPNLRGESYNKRHKLQKEVLNDLETICAEATSPAYWWDKK